MFSLRNAVLVYLLIDSVFFVLMVGKPRIVITPNIAAFNLLFNVAIFFLTFKYGK
jgi:hypothetical protein